MPTLFLSPSAQEYNEYATGGSEEQYMNLLADAMEPYLRSTGIVYTRNNPDDTLSQIIQQSNAGNYDFHLALHSNAAPESLRGRLHGTDVYYYAASPEGRRGAEIIAENFKNIAIDPSMVRAIPTTTLAELSRTKAPAALIEVAYHDNVPDANWIIDNLQVIARNLVQSLAQYFGIPFIEAQPTRTGTVVTGGSQLNIRSRPGMDAEVLTTVPNGTTLEVLGRWQNWYVVQYGDMVGYASRQYIEINQNHRLNRWFDHAL